MALNFTYNTTLFDPTVATSMSIALTPARVSAATDAEAA